MNSSRSLESAFQSQELILSPSRARPGKLAKVDNGEEDKMSDAGSVTGLPSVEAMREALGSNQNQSKGRASTGGAAGSGAKPQPVNGTGSGLTTTERRLLEHLTKLTLQLDEVRAQSARDQNVVFEMGVDHALAVQMRDTETRYKAIGEKTREDQGKEFRGHPWGKKPTLMMNGSAAQSSGNDGVPHGSHVQARKCRAGGGGPVDRGRPEMFANTC